MLLLCESTRPFHTTHVRTSVNLSTQASCVFLTMTWKVLLISSQKYNFMYIYCDGRSTRQTQWVWRQASERLLLNRNNTIKVSKGNKVSKIKGGIWCPRCAAGCEGGAVSGRKGPGKGRSPAAARAPLRGPGREGRRLFQRLRHL